MKIVIIGGTGYAGSRLFNHLKSSHIVHTIDLEWFGNFTNPDNFKTNYCYVPFDFWFQYDAIILLAGHSSVPMCKDKMIDSYENNVTNFVNLLSKIGNKKLIYASSSSVYGNTMGLTAPETWDRFNPNNYYDLSKKVIDLYAQTKGANYYGLRMGTLSGASPNLRVDIMINKMYDAARTTGKITIFNPEIYRPILGISDFCRAVTCLVEQNAEPGIYNLASFNANVAQISRAVADNIKDVEVLNTGSSPTYDFSIDTSKFEKAFNFKFEDTVHTIVQSLDETYDQCNKGIRV